MTWASWDSVFLEWHFVFRVCHLCERLHFGFQQSREKWFYSAHYFLIFREFVVDHLIQFVWRCLLLFHFDVLWQFVHILSRGRVLTLGRIFCQYLYKKLVLMYHRLGLKLPHKISHHSQKKGLFHRYYPWFVVEIVVQLVGFVHCCKHP